jgi:ribulose-bisphosphate carboxylase large chain
MQDLRSQNTSRLLRFLGNFEWSQVEKAEYKPVDDSWRGVTRRVLVGEMGESTAFHVRYFEIEPGGYTTLESHRHEHCVVALRGRGQALVGGQTLQMGFGDVLYVAPGEPHQFRNDGGVEPFGFLCVVDAERDRPRPVGCSICQ